MRKWIAIILTVLFLLGAAGGAYMYWFHSARIVIDETVYPRDMTELDLSGTPVGELDRLAELTGLQTLDLRDTGLTTQEYEKLRQVLPECRILWSVPFQNDHFSNETSKLAVTSLSEEDIRMLEYFPNLKALDAQGCRDYEALLSLTADRPDLEIFYEVSVDGQTYRNDTKELTLKNGDIQELEAVIPYLPLLERVEFTGTVPENDRIYELMCAYPQVIFAWGFEIMGVQTNSMAEELILSGIPMESVENVENALKYFYRLKWVEMCDCGIPSEEMDALWKRHPETRFVWTVQVGSAVLRTDITALMPSQYGLLGAKGLKDYESYKELRYCVDMVCMDLGHERMTDFSFLAYMPKLKYLILADTHSRDYSALAGREELVFLELFLTDFDQAEILTTLTGLEDLNLSRSGITNIEPILEMDWLHRLWLSGNGFSEEEQQRIREALPNTVVVFNGRGCTDKGWRESPNYYAMRDLLGMDYMEG